MKTALKSKPARKKAWFVYMLRCSNGSLYTGIATDVQARLLVHNAGKGSAYVRSHRPAKLVAFVSSPDRSKASVLEYQVKSLTRVQKLALAKTWKTRNKKKAVPGAGAKKGKRSEVKGVTSANQFGLE